MSSFAALSPELSSEFIPRPTLSLQTLCTEFKVETGNQVMTEDSDHVSDVAAWPTATGWLTRNAPSLWHLFGSSGARLPRVSLSLAGCLAPSRRSGTSSRERARLSLSFSLSLSLSLSLALSFAPLFFPAHPALVQVTLRAARGEGLQWFSTWTTLLSHGV